MVLFIYFVRVWLLRGFYIVTYGLGIYNLNLLIGFLSPQIDPDTEGPQLPTKSDQEFKPFVRRLPEFKFWRAAMKSLLIGFTMTFFPMFDLPVFWPVLLLYWIMLFTVTMKKQIKHMIKYKYLPFSFGKRNTPTLAGKDLAPRAKGERAKGEERRVDRRKRKIFPRLGGIKLKK